MEMVEKRENGIEEQYEGESCPDRVVARGYGLSTGLAGQANSFTLDARDAGFGDFDVVIKGASRASIEYIEEEDAVYKIKYHVQSSGDYQIEIKYDMKHIPGSPFTAKIMEPTNNNNVDSSEFNSKGTADAESFPSVSTHAKTNNGETHQEKQMKQLPIDASILTPSGRVIKGIVYQKQNKEVSVKFPREEIGTYTVTLRQQSSNKLIGNSPYEVYVRSKDVDCTSITASGEGLNEARLDRTNGFSLVSKKDIVSEHLWILMYGLGSIKMNVYQNDLESLDVLYELKKAGTYHIHLLENGKTITGPYTVSTIGSVENFFSAYVVTIWHGYIDSDNSLKTKLTTPEGKSISHSMTKRGKHFIDIKFLPTQNGEYVLEVFNDDVQQTFNILVENLPNSQEDIVKITGDGLQSAIVNKQSLLFISSLIPIKSFSVEFDGPSSVEISQTPQKDNKCMIEYTGRSAGRYILSIKYDGFHIAKSPYFVNIFPEDDSLTGRDSILAIENTESEEGDATKCIASGKALYSAYIGQPMSFTVDTTDAGCGGLMAGFKGSRNKPTEISCKNIGNFLYEVQYTISEKGAYKLSVLWEGDHIPGSPFGISAMDG